MNSQPEVTNETLRLVLVSWDMDKPDGPPTPPYTGHHLMRSCHNERADGPCTQGVFGLANGLRAVNDIAALPNLAGFGHVRAFQQTAVNETQWRLTA